MRGVFLEATFFQIDDLLGGLFDDHREVGYSHVGRRFCTGRSRYDLPNSLDDGLFGKYGKGRHLLLELADNQDYMRCWRCETLCLLPWLA